MELRDEVLHQPDLVELRSKHLSPEDCSFSPPKTGLYKTEVVGNIAIFHCSIAERTLLIFSKINRRLKETVGQD
jgi:hypothetical protein